MDFYGLSASCFKARTPDLAHWRKIHSLPLSALSALSFFQFYPYVLLVSSLSSLCSSLSSSIFSRLYPYCTPFFLPVFSIVFSLYQQPKVKSCEGSALWSLIKQSGQCCREKKMLPNMFNVFLSTKHALSQAVLFFPCVLLWQQILSGHLGTLSWNSYSLSVSHHSHLQIEPSCILKAHKNAVSIEHSWEKL